VGEDGPDAAVGEAVGLAVVLVIEAICGFEESIAGPVVVVEHRAEVLGVQGQASFGGSIRGCEETTNKQTSKGGKRAKGAKDIRA
jgi:hypothetical protein